MKSRNKVRKSELGDFGASSDETKKHKLKPQKKEKNPKRTFFEEIDDELEDFDFDDLGGFDDEYFDDDDDDDF